MDQAIRVVLIEDEPADVYWFQYILREMGQPHELTVYKTGTAALEKLGGLEKPDVIFTDWFLPVLNAPEFLADLKRIPGLSDVPLYVVTGIRDLLQEAMKAGALRCLTKPVDARQLQDVFEELPRARAATAPIIGPLEANRPATA